MHPQRSRTNLKKVSPIPPGQLSAGVDLDKLIATRVLGWDKKRAASPPKFSTSLDAAMGAVDFVERLITEKGNEDMDTFSLDSYGEGEFTASFGDYYWSRSTLPAHATVLACLEVVEAIAKEN